MAGTPLNRASRADIDGICGGLTPNGVPAEDNGEIFDGFDRDAGLDIDKITRGNKGRFTEVAEPREQSIEGAERPIMGLLVTAGDIGFETDPGFPVDSSEGVSSIGGNCQGPDVVLIEAAHLTRGLPVPVPSRGAAKNTHADRVTFLIPQNTTVFRQIVLKAKIIEIKIQAWQSRHWKCAVDTPECLIGI